MQLQLAQLIQLVDWGKVWVHWLGRLEQLAYKEALRGDFGTILAHSKEIESK